MEKILDDLCMVGFEKYSTYARSKEEKQCLQEITEIEKQFLTLFPECRELFLRYSGLTSDLNGYEEEQTFKNGICMGARLMLELFSPEHLIPRKEYVPQERP